MRMALFGRGGMGRVVAERARAAGHDVGVVIGSGDSGASPAQVAARLRDHDVAVDFSAPDGVLPHALACAQARVPLVEGTTGWQDREAAVRRAVDEAGGALVYGANFSIGAGLFHRLVARAGELFRGLPEYEAFIEEAHHARKRDVPSGTALRLRDALAGALGRTVPIASTRAGYIPGTHRVGFDAPAEQVVLEHTARSRDGFAAGALLAAQWIVGRRGVFAFEQVLDDVLAAARGKE